MSFQGTNAMNASNELDNIKSGVDTISTIIDETKDDMKNISDNLEYLKELQQTIMQEFEAISKLVLSNPNQS